MELADWARYLRGNRIPVLRALRVLTRNPVLPLFAVRPIAKALATRPKKTTTRIVCVDVVIQEQSNIPIATQTHGSSVVLILLPILIVGTEHVFETVRVTCVSLSS